MSIFLQFSVKIIQPIRHCKASKGGLFYVKPPSPLHGLNLPMHEEAMFNDSAVNEKKGRADMCQAGVRISGRGKNLNNCLNYFWRRFICYAAVTRSRFKQHSFAARGWTSKTEPQSQVLKTMRGYVSRVVQTRPDFLLPSQVRVEDEDFPLRVEEPGWSSLVSPPALFKVPTKLFFVQLCSTFLKLCSTFPPLFYAWNT